jgi:hypothetical protein
VGEPHSNQKTENGLNGPPQAFPGAFFTRKKNLRGPFKPFFGLSGIVFSPVFINSLSLAYTTLSRAAFH